MWRKLGMVWRPSAIHQSKPCNEFVRQAKIICIIQIYLYRTPPLYIHLDEYGSGWLDDVGRTVEEADRRMPATYRAEPIGFGFVLRRPYRLFDASGI